MSTKTSLINTQNLKKNVLLKYELTKFWRFKIFQQKISAKKVIQLLSEQTNLRFEPYFTLQQERVSNASINLQIEVTLLVFLMPMYCFSSTKVWKQTRVMLQAKASLGILAGLSINETLDATALFLSSGTSPLRSVSWNAAWHSEYNTTVKSMKCSTRYNKMSHGPTGLEGTEERAGKVV